MKKKRKEPKAVAAACQLRSGQVHPFTDLRGFVPLGVGEERVYRQVREAIPVLDAAVGKLAEARLKRALVRKSVASVK